MRFATAAVILLVSLPVHAERFLRTGLTAISSPVAVALADGRVLVVCDDTTAAQLYDPATHSVAATGSLNYSRSGCAASRLMDGRVLVTGGRRFVNSFTAELYDPSTGSFTLTPGLMTLDRIAHTSTLLPTGKVLLTGGTFFQPAVGEAGTSNSAEVYDPATGGFTRIGSMSKERSYHAASLLSDGRVLISGGTAALGSGYNPTATTDIFNGTDAFIAGPTMNQTRARHTSTTLENGEVFVLGISGFGPHAYPELFTPTTNLLRPASSTTPVAALRIRHGATRLDDGRVLVTGGSGQLNDLLYDPETATYELLPSVAYPAAGKVDPAVALLRDGDVFIGNTTVELFDPHLSATDKGDLNLDRNSDSFEYSCDHAAGIRPPLLTTPANG